MQEDLAHRAHAFARLPLVFVGSQAHTHWGRLSWKGATPPGSSLALHTRSGNLTTPAQYWSNWSKPIATGDGAPVESPAARSLQWKAVLETRGAESPVLDTVTIAYRPKNIAPTITEMEITPPNYKFPDPPATNPPPSLSLPTLGSRPSRSSTPSFQPARSMPPAKGYLGVRWFASDENEDDLVAKVEIRGVNEHNWKLLEDHVDNPHLSWDSTAFADGLY